MTDNTNQIDSRSIPIPGSQEEAKAGYQPDMGNLPVVQKPDEEQKDEIDEKVRIEAAKELLKGGAPFDNIQAIMGKDFNLLELEKEIVMKEIDPTDL